MARKTTRKKTKQKPSKLKRISWLLLFGFVAIAFTPLFIVFATGMLPTVAAYLGDKKDKKPMMRCVGFMNFIGVFWVMLPLVRFGGRQTIDNASQMVSDPDNIIIMYSLSIVGLIIYKVTPMITGYVLFTYHTRMKEQIQARLDNLYKLWGERVARDAPALMSDKEFSRDV